MRKRCKRKVWALVNPIEHAIDGARVSGDDILSSLRTRELSAIEAFRTGKARLQEWADIVAMMNVAEHMAFRGVGPEAKQVCDDLHTHLIEAARRYTKTKRMGATGPALQCMRDAYEYHDLQRKSVSRSEYERHIKETSDRIRSKAPEVYDVMGVAA